MSRERIVETDQGIQDEFTVEMYDLMMRRMRDRGLMETGDIIRNGIDSGHALEIGPGPGYLGLEWLKATTGTRVTGAEISPAMIAKAKENAEQYGLAERISYVLGDAGELPFPENTFDAVFTNGSLHEWADPKAIMAEMHRVLKTGGRWYISDLKRNTMWLIRRFLIAFTKPKEMVPGLITSLNAAYTPEEIREIVSHTPLSGSVVKSNLFGMTIAGSKK